MRRAPVGYLAVPHIRTHAQRSPVVGITLFVELDLDQEHRRVMYIAGGLAPDHGSPKDIDSRAGREMLASIGLNALDWDQHAWPCMRRPDG